MTASPDLQKRGSAFTQVLRHVGSDNLRTPLGGRVIRITLSHPLRDLMYRARVASSSVEDRASQLRDQANDYQMNDQRLGRREVWTRPSAAVASVFMAFAFASTVGSPGTLLAANGDVTKAALADVQRGFGVASFIERDSVTGRVPENYLVGHSALVFVVSKDGRIATLLPGDGRAEWLFNNLSAQLGQRG